jgi:hypothetical protein
MLAAEVMAVAAVTPASSNAARCNLALRRLNF